MPDYQSMTAGDIVASVRDKKISAVEITHQALRLAKTVGKDLNAFITICEDKALEQAREIDRYVTSVSGAPEARSLLGVPVAIKDNICYRDYPTTCASRMLETYISPYDATVVSHLIAAGAIIIGKTNMDEFGIGSSSEFSHFGPVKNPLDDDLVPGGSSGGSAAAVAAGIVPIAYGSDTGGSIRQPAAFCGVHGLKPTYGSVSRYGLVAFASSLDQIGPLARNSGDLALALQPLVGQDPHDATSRQHGYPDYATDLDTDRKFRIGLPREYLSEGLDPANAERFEILVHSLEKSGHVIVDLALPLTDKAIDVYYIIANAEASSNLARYDGVRYGHREMHDDLKEMYAATRAAGFGDEVKRRIMLGTFVLSSGYYDQYYRKALEVRELIRRDFENAFERVDLLLTPTTPTPPFKRGERLDDPLAMYLSDVYTVSANLGGIPAISVPVRGMESFPPLAVQFMAPVFGERELLQIARVVERLERM